MLTYNKEMDQLVLINGITPNKVTKSNSPTCTKGENTNMEDEKETMPLGTPRSKLAFNDMHQTLMGPGSIQHLWNKS